MYSHQGIAKRQLLAWNAFGIFDFVIAVAIGTLSRSGELLHFSGTISNDAMGSVPLVLIPGFVVPFYRYFAAATAWHRKYSHSLLISENKGGGRTGLGDSLCIPY
jgi:hypothetical protein